MVMNELLGGVVAGALLVAFIPNVARADPAGAHSMVALNGLPFGGALYNAGLVVGSEGSRVLIWQPGGAQPLAVPSLALPDTGLMGVSVSGNGQIATTVRTGGPQLAQRWQSGANSLLANAGLETRAYGINDAGLVVGRTRYPAGGFFPTIDVATAWGMDGVATELGNLGCCSSQALAVNNEGLVVGWSETAALTVRAVQWFQGVPTALVSPGAARSTKPGASANPASSSARRAMPPDWTAQRCG